MAKKTAGKNSKRIGSTPQSVDMLAILGGKPVRKKPFDYYPAFGKEELSAVINVMKSKKLSGFYADFLGGQKVKEFEAAFAKYHSVKHAIAVNSGTSALHIAVAAAGLGPGDEVITTPYTFTATASSILMHNAIPVFADIDPVTFNIDPAEIEKKITQSTKAILPVHLYGHPADMDAIMRIAKKHNLKVIEDVCQSPGSKYNGKLAGTFGDMACFSLVETKNIVTGEGGVIITNDDILAERCRLVRNHGEARAVGKPREYISNILGWNYRMTELEAAIGLCQIKKLDSLNKIRVKNASFLAAELGKIKNFSKYFDLPKSVGNVGVVPHLYALKYKPEAAGISREVIINALSAEGIPVSVGYPHPLYENPVFRDKKVYGEKGCPYNCKFYSGSVDYSAGMCPNAEYLSKKSVIWFTRIAYPQTINDINDVAAAFEKLVKNMDELKDFKTKTRNLTELKT